MGSFSMHHCKHYLFDHETPFVPFTPLSFHIFGHIGATPLPQLLLNKSPFGHLFNWLFLLLQVKLALH